MFGGYLWRFLQWLGLWNCYIAFWTLAIGVWSGMMWRLSPAGERAVRGTTARPAVLPRVSLGDAGFGLSQSE
jgi:hypothetical protein